MQNCTRDARGGDVLESHRVANLRAEHDAHLVGDSRGHRLRGDAPWLGARHHTTPGGPPSLDEVLRHLRRLAASRLPHQHCRRARLHEVQDGVAALEDGKTFPLCRKGEALIPVVHQQAPALTDAPAIHFRAQRQPCLRFLAPGFQNAMTRSLVRMPDVRSDGHQTETGESALESRRRHARASQHEHACLPSTLGGDRARASVSAARAPREKWKFGRRRSPDGGGDEDCWAQAPPNI